MVGIEAQANAKTVPVFLKSEGKDEVKFELPPGSMGVAEIKAALGVAPEESLFLKDHGKRVLLPDQDTIEVKAGLHFEAIRGGGVS